MLSKKSSSIQPTTAQRRGMYVGYSVPGVTTSTVHRCVRIHESFSIVACTTCSRSALIPVCIFILLRIPGDDEEYRRCCGRMLHTFSSFCQIDVQNASRLLYMLLQCELPKNCFPPCTERETDPIGTQSASRRPPRASGQRSMTRFFVASFAVAIVAGMLLG